MPVNYLKTSARCAVCLALVSAFISFQNASALEPSALEQMAAAENQKAAVSPASEPQENNSARMEAGSEAKISFGGYLSGRFAESSGDSDKTVQFLTDALAHDPANSDLLLNLYRSYIAAGNISAALEPAEKLVKAQLFDETSEFSPALLLSLAEAKKGNYAQALLYLQPVPRTGFNSITLPLLEVWLKAGAGSIKAPVKAKDIMPNGKVVLSHVALNAAFINDMLGFTKEAQQEYEEAGQEKRLETTRIAEALVNYYDRSHQEEKRASFIAAYTDTHGETIINTTTPGVKSVPLVANVPEGLAEALYTVASIFHGVRAPADEIVTLQLALYLRPDFPAAEFLLGSAFDLKKSYKQAIPAYQQVLPSSAYFIPSQIMIAYDNSEMGNNETAFQILDKLIASEGGSLLPLIAKADLLRIRSDFGAAAGLYDEAIKHISVKRKADWLLYFSRGICFHRLGQIGRADEDMKKALEINPGNPDVLNYLGYSWLESGRNLKEARKMVEQAYDARPEDPQIIDSMGYALYQSGDYDSAKEYFERALERMPEEPTVNEHLGDAYYKLGRKTEAKFQWQRALDSKPDDKSRDILLKKMESGIENPNAENAAAFVK